MRKHVFITTVSILVVILVIVSFYMLNVHIPYYKHNHQLDELRNEICETNHYEYMDYFFEYRGKEVLYVMKVKINDVESYVAYNHDKKLVDVYQGPVANQDNVLKAIEKKYKVQIDNLDIAYDQSKFIYYAKYQDKDTLMYFYYDLKTGDFIRTVQLGDQNNG